MPKNYPKLGQTVYQFIIYFPTKTTVFLLRMFPCTLVTSCVCLQSIPKPTTWDLSSDRSVHKIRLDLTLRWKKVTKISSYQMVVKTMVMNPHGIESVNKNHTTKKHIERWMPYIYRFDSFPLLPLWTNSQHPTFHAPSQGSRRVQHSWGRFLVVPRYRWWYIHNQPKIIALNQRFEPNQVLVKDSQEPGRVYS